MLTRHRNSLEHEQEGHHSCLRAPAVKAPVPRVQPTPWRRTPPRSRCQHPSDARILWGGIPCVRARAGGWVGWSFLDRKPWTSRALFHRRSTPRATCLVEDSSIANMGSGPVSGTGRGCSRGRGLHETRKTDKTIDRRSCRGVGCRGRCTSRVGCGLQREGVVQERDVQRGDRLPGLERAGRGRPDASRPDVRQPVVRRKIRVVVY